MKRYDAPTRRRFSSLREYKMFFRYSLIVLISICNARVHLSFSFGLSVYTTGVMFIIEWSKAEVSFKFNLVQKTVVNFDKFVVTICQRYFRNLIEKLR